MRLVLAVLAALAAVPAALAELQPEPSQRVVVTRETAATPPECGPAEAAELVIAFARDPERLFVEPFLRFAVVGGPAPIRADDRAQALEYLRRHGPWRAYAVGVGPGDPRQIALEAILAFGGRRYDAKLVVDCTAGAVHGAVLSATLVRTICGVPLSEEQVAACATGPNAVVFAPSFVLDTANGVFERGCAPGAVRDRVKAMLYAFNHGDGKSFAAGLRRDAKVVADRIPVLPRTMLARWVRGEFKRGIGWTATRLRSGTMHGSRATYGLNLDVTREGEPIGHAGVKLVIQCSSGLVVHWGGGRVEP